MAGHSRSKNGVASLAYVPAIYVFLDGNTAKTWMPATSAGMTPSVRNDYSRGRTVTMTNRFGLSSVPK
jgi:hypothetical protein